MFDVQVISVSLSQKPIVSPYQRGTSAPRRGTSPSILNSRPTWMFVMKLRATPVKICTACGRDHDVPLPGRELVPAAHEAFGPAVLRRPLRAIRDAFVIGLLHHALLILRREQRQDRRHLVVPHPVPVRLTGRVAGMHVAAVPFVRQRRVGLLRRAAALLRLREQRLVVLLRRLERIGAHDRLARIVAVAASPRGRRSAGFSPISRAPFAPHCSSMATELLQRK